MSNIPTLVSLQNNVQRDFERDGIKARKAAEQAAKAQEQAKKEAD